MMDTTMALKYKLSLLLIVKMVLHCNGDSDSLSRTQAPSKRLFDDLMTNYGSRSVRPVWNHSEPVRVRMFYKPTILSEFNEQNQQLSVVGTMYMEWTDEFLTWDPTDYGGVERISIRMEDVWFPDITAYERLDVKESYVNFFEPYAIVNSSGVIQYYQLTDLTVYCRLSMTLFPFDKQRCTIAFTSYSYDSEQFALAYANTSDAFENRFQPNGVWQLDHFEVKEVEKEYLCCPKPYVEVHYDFIMQRIGSFYVYSIWIPSGLLSSMIVAVFVMHPNSGEKVTLSVSNVLAFVLFQQIVVGSMPRSGDDSPVIVVFFSGMIAISCLSVLASAVVLRVYYHDPKKPVPRIFRFLILRRKRGKRNESYSIVDGHNNVPSHEENGNSPSNINAGNGDIILNDVIGGQTEDHLHTKRLGSNHSDGVDSRNTPTKQEDTEWMILALMMDKLFLVTAVCALLGTVVYCGIQYLILMNRELYL